MATVLYADVLFLLNFSMDFLSLAASASLLSLRKRPVRISIASALGALYAVTFTVADIKGLISLISAVVSGAAMCIISFGYSGLKDLIYETSLMAGCGALMGGVMTAFLSSGVYIPAPTIIVSSVVLSFFVIRSAKMRKGCISVEVEITYRNKTSSFSALCDSGNLMRDPFGAAPVMLVSRDALGTLLRQSEISSLMAFDGNFPDGMIIRPVPDYSNGNKRICAAFRADKVKVKNGRRVLDADCFIAISTHPKGYFGGHDATVPSALIP